LDLLREEEQILSAYQGFQKILFNNTLDLRAGPALGQESSDALVKIQLYTTLIFAPDTFHQIKSRFMDVFPFVEDLKIVSPAEEATNLSVLGAFPRIQIKEKGIDDGEEEEFCVGR